MPMNRTLTPATAATTVISSTGPMDFIMRTSRLIELKILKANFMGVELKFCSEKKLYVFFFVSKVRSDF